MSGEALVVCGARCHGVGSDSCTLPGQVTKLVVEGCRITSAVSCCSVSVDELLAPPISVLCVGKSN